MRPTTYIFSGEENVSDQETFCVFHIGTLGFGEVLLKAETVRLMGLITERLAPAKKHVGLDTVSRPHGRTIGLLVAAGLGRTT